MLWQEEAFEQPVDAKQSFASQGDTFRTALGDVPVCRDRVERVAETLDRKSVV